MLILSQLLHNNQARIVGIKLLKAYAGLTRHQNGIWIDSSAILEIQIWPLVFIVTNIFRSIACIILKNYHAE